MILDAIISVLNPIIDTYTAVGDINAAVPFAVIQVEPSPIRSKDGIIGYTQKASVTLVDTDITRIDANAQAVFAAIAAMSGTIQGCVINDVLFESEQGISFDQLSNSYQNSLDFNFDTDNR